MPTTLITGASRGLGLEFVRQYAAAGWDVIACARKPEQAAELQTLKRRWSGSVFVEPLDVTNAQQVESLAGRYAHQPIDVLINNAGDIGPRGAHRERINEQFFGSLNYDAWLKLFEVNTLGPMRMAEAFASSVERGSEKKMVFISSTTASNVEGIYNIFSYCSTKAALNKCVTMLARAVKDRGIVVAAFCPGHAKTELGGAGATVEVADSIAAMRKLIAKLTMNDSGTFTRYNGARVPW